MTTRPDNYLGRFLVWRIKHIPQKQFIILLSILVGLITGFVAVILKNSTHAIQELVTSERLRDYHQVYYFLFPIIGILITVLIKRWLPGPLGEGIPSTLYAISRRNGILKPFKMFASVITSAFTVGMGGSVGLEGPTVSTGSAIGSNVGRILHLTYKQRILLIGCATAGAIASIFNAPIAA
ncbi:MAG: chloride channel protein, partial [Bacteroidetes bacterium]